MAGFSNNTMYADNVAFDGGKAPTVNTNGQLLIGSTATPNIRVGSLGSSDGSITWTTGAGTITGQVAGGTTVGKTITGDTGGALSPTAGNWNLLGSGSITTAGSGSTLTTQLTGLTNHAVLVGAGTSTITKLTVGTNGQVLLGSTGADPVFATLTSTGGTITFTTGAGTLNLEASTSGSVYGVSNIGVAYSNPTFTVQGYNGSAMSASNPGKAWVQSKATPGQLVQISATENFTFTDGTTGTTDNQRFGLTTGVSWAQDIPFFLYMIAHDTPSSAPAFGISRNPAATNAPAAASIGVSGAVVNVGQGDFFLLTGGTSGVPTVGNYDTNPCVCIGSFRMQFAGATDSWTVQTLATTDGVGQFNESTVFTFPSGQSGAASGTYVVSNAGTEPVFTTNNMTYSIYRTGLVKYIFDGQNASTAGVGANTMQPVLPYALKATPPAQEPYITGRYKSNAGANLCMMGGASAGAAFVSAFFATSGTNAFANSDFALTTDLQFQTIYRAY